MRVLTIPMLSYFTGDSYNHRTDMALQCSTPFIASMKERFNLQLNTLKTVYTYDGNRIPVDAYKTVNNFFGDDLIPYLGIQYHCAYNSTYMPGDDDTWWSEIEDFVYTLGIHMNRFQLPDAVSTQGSYYYRPSRVVSPFNLSELNNTNIQIGAINLGNYQMFNLGGANAYSLNIFSIADLPTFKMEAYFNGTIFPDNVFDDDGIRPAAEGEEYLSYTCNIKYTKGIDGSKGISEIIVRFTLHEYTTNKLAPQFATFNPKNAGITESDTDKDDPYSDDGSSTEGGGDGGGGGSWIDHVDPVEIPSLPTINVCDLGLITMYNPSESTVKDFANFLWSGIFDPATWKKLFAEPMDSVIGLALVPVAPTLAGSKNIKVGNIDSGVTSPYLSSNWVAVDCGWVNIEKYVGCFMDADPYTKISLYLPGVGYRSLAADDVNGGSIHVVYHLDCLTGSCVAFVQHSSRGVLYQYNGTLICNVPLTSQNFAGALQNAVSALFSGAGLVAGIAAGASSVPVAVGALGLAATAANTVMNSKPAIQRSGSMGGAAGILSTLTPYVIIERPDISVPANMKHYVGNTSNITYKLNSISGFTACEYVHIEGCTGTSEEVAEIESLLKQGVYL